jgi:hypothetical protein
LTYIYEISILFSLGKVTLAIRSIIVCGLEKLDYIENI